MRHDHQSTNSQSTTVNIIEHGGLIHLAITGRRMQGIADVTRGAALHRSKCMLVPTFSCTFWHGGCVLVRVVGAFICISNIEYG